ncbi:hypothetical protein CLU79DRAFT_775971 [Phycomyces nitens]|nr:hypothetical protein CLU79DRAFT_775971 [Phycomyces nitens]
MPKGVLFSKDPFFYFYFLITNSIQFNSTLPAPTRIRNHCKIQEMSCKYSLYIQVV